MLSVVECPGMKKTEKTRAVYILTHDHKQHALSSETEADFRNPELQSDDAESAGVNAGERRTGGPQPAP